VSQPSIEATNARNGETPLLALVKEVIDGLGILLTGHVRLARVELAADVASASRRVALVSLLSAVTLLGYALACIAASLALARWVPAPLAFLAVGGAHLVGAGLGLAWLLSRAPASLLGASASELNRTVSTLKASATSTSVTSQRPFEGGVSHDLT
jgi:uncharacterized membrane protein YqjE